MLCPKQLLRPINRRLLHLIHKLASPIPPLTRIALSILIRQTRPLRLHHRRTGKVFRSDQLNIFRLAPMLTPNRFGHQSICPRQISAHWIPGVRSPHSFQSINFLLIPRARKGSRNPLLHARPRICRTQLIRPQAQYICVIPLPRTTRRLGRSGHHRPHLGKTV